MFKLKQMYTNADMHIIYTERLTVYCVQKKKKVLRQTCPHVIKYKLYNEKITMNYKRI